MNKEQLWFSDFRNELSLTTKEEKALIQYLTVALSQQQKKVKLTNKLQEDRQPRLLFISLSDGQKTASVIFGSGRGIIKAIEDAISQIPRQLQNIKWLKLDIVQSVFSLSRLNLKRPLYKARSLQGLAFDRESKIAFLPEELLANNLLNINLNIQPRNILKYLENNSEKTQAYQRILASDRLQIYRFTTTSLFTENNQCIPLYRGHRWFDKLEREQILAAAFDGGEYLTRAIEPNGKFVYIYQPKTNNVPNKYNILRHAGTIYSLLELYEITQNQQFLITAESAIAFLLQTLHPYETPQGKVKCVVEDGFVKLGGNALAAIALSKYTQVTKSQEYLAIIQELATWMASVQNDTGEFVVHKQSYPEGKVRSFLSEYYPGEAILAMLRLYQLDSQDRWLDVAANAAKFLIEVRDYNLPDSKLPHDHWLLYGLNELYRDRPEQLYLNHGLRLAHAIVDKQNLNPSYPDWQGSYYQPPRSTPTATRSEGLYAAYQLAKFVGKDEDAKTFLAAMKRGIKFQLQTQFQPESVLYLPNPRRAIGGFHRSLTNFEIRIDYIQHNISSLLGLYQII
ncbi:MAG: hypothetical protein SAJ37_01825 [Oscillatoria sp. PMC 1068.18]|nr:hypothetical protein [Oscillatoria sp. PMC 1076.18]MEC4984775.1 hypothetical protein [Oscillatoria sp. PMC 1076.18]MEC4987461.1 hypothetical protein [Oscillatoria sp. PMC 1068.18]